MSRLMKLFGAGFMFLPMMVARADFYPQGGTVWRLVHESQELTQVVRYVGLPYQVQQAVGQFNYAVYQLAECVRFNSGGNMQVMGVPPQCSPNLQMASRSFLFVERCLSGGFYQIPQVYRSAMETREALMSLQASGFPCGPGYQPGPGYPVGPGYQPGPGYPNGPGYQPGYPFGPGRGPIVN